MKLIVLKEDEIDSSLFIRFQEDFPKLEGFTLEDWKRETEEGNFLTVKLLEDKKEVGYAILMKEKEYIFLNVVAIYTEYRGLGYGTMFLEELKKVYESKKAIFLEVEKVEEKNSIQEKRYRFYERSGFQDTGILVELWGTEYQILVLELQGKVEKNELKQVEKEIYRKLLGEKGLEKYFKIK